MDRKYALIPAYEPDGRLLEIIEDAVAEGFQVIVVDDGSSDDCQQPRSGRKCSIEKQIWKYCHKIRIQTCIGGESS